MINFSNDKRIIVTSALPYANGPIHIGHLVEYIQTDVFVRFLRLVGKNAVYCCADDTHGTPIEIAAKKAGVLPEEIIGKFHKEHLEDFKSFNINFDSYYSTNSEENKKLSDLFFSRLKKKGLIYQKDVKLTYCEKCKRFLPDRYVKGRCPKCNSDGQYGDICEKCNEAYKTTDLVDPFCTICGASPVNKISNHYFFKLGQCSDALKKWLKENRSLQPEVVNFVLNWIKEGLQDWNISRDGPYFGFKIPGEENLYYYVWLDAPIGYISSFSKLIGSIEKTEKEWNGSEIIHVIGKDIIYFHLLFWPAMLQNADFKLPNNIMVHGFLTVNGEKMSKSRGTFLTAKDYLKVLDPEYLRFYYAANLSHKMNDIDLDLDDFKSRINNELIANISNFSFRALSFTNKNFESKITKIKADNNIKELIKKTEGLVKKIEKNYENFDFREAVQNILAVSALGNKYFQDNAPWKLIKDDKNKAQNVLNVAINLVKNLSILISPILPNFSEKLQEQLNLKKLLWKDINFDLKDHNINKSKILVKKIEDETANLIKANPCSILNIKVAKIISAEDHPDADKLYVLKIDLGKEKRQLVAGIKKYYKKEDLIGKHICVLTNLKPAKLRGVESQGMILAGEDDKDVGLLIPDGKPGEQVFFEGITPKTEQVEYTDFTKIRIIIDKGRINYDNKILKTKKAAVSVEKISKGIVA